MAPPGTRLRSARGFTMLEMMVAVAIVAVIAAITINALGTLKRKGNFTTATRSMLVALRAARAEAYGRGVTTRFVVDTNNGRWWSIADTNNDFVLDTWDPNTPAPGTDVLLDSGTFPTGVTFGPAAGYGTLPAPFTVIPSGNACTFCLTSGSRSGYGAITFRVGNGATFTGSAATGASMTLQGNSQSGTGGGKYTLAIAVVGRTGATEMFEVFK